MLGLCEPSSEPLAARSRKQTHPEPSPPAPTATSRPSVSAVEMGARQREISVSEFFTKNRHLLGFDNPRKALLTCVKEAVDNALDACEEAGILPDVVVKLEAVANGEAAPPASQASRFRITVTDNGPGIVRQQIPPIFAKLLYGSKFHRLRMSRGQQGIGISAAGMYGQLTTGKPVQITSRTSARAPAHYFEVQIDTKKNEPRILEKKQIAWESPRGTQVTMEIEGRYQKGRASVDEYIEQTIIANSHVKLTYVPPEGETKEYARSYEQLPPAPREIKPHPYGIEAGLAFGRAPEQAAQTPATKAIPLAEGEAEKDDHEVARIIRYANRVPLLYQPAACEITKAVLDTTWRNYGVAQSRGSLPAGPMVIFVHMASVWVPFTSESKEAIAEYDEIHKEITLALRECGRRLGAFLRRRERAHSEFRRRNIFELYIEEIVQSCNRLKGGRLATAKLRDQLLKMATKITGGGKTDELLGKNGSGPEGLPHSIIVTPEGVEGEVPVVAPNGAPAAEEPVAPPAAPEARAPRKTKGKATPKPRAGRKKKR